MKWIEATCLVVVTAALTFLLYEGGMFFRDSRDQIAALGSSAQATIQHTNAVEDRLSMAADEQTVYWQKTEQQVYKLVTDTKGIIVRTDRSLNDELIPSVKRSVDASTALQQQAARNLGDATVHIDTAIDSLEPGIASFNKAATGAATAMSDPAIHETLVNIDGITADGHTETSLFVDRTRKAFAPKNKFLSLLQLAGGGTLSAAEFYYYLTH